MYKTSLLIVSVVWLWMDGPRRKLSFVLWFVHEQILEKCCVARNDPPRLFVTLLFGHNILYII